MKKIFLIAALFAAGCGGQKSVEPAASPAAKPASRSVVVGRFSGEVDGATGLVTIRHEASRNSGANFTTFGGVGGVVTIQQTVPAQVVTVPAGCDSANQALTAPVQISVGPGSNLGMVYAQIDTVTGTSVVPCNNVNPAPVGLVNTYGLISYGQIASGSSAVVEWSFPVTGNARFGFSGEIHAVVEDLYQGPGLATVRTSLANVGGQIIYGGEYYNDPTDPDPLVFISVASAEMTYVTGLLPVGASWMSVATGTPASIIWWTAVDALDPAGPIPYMGVTNLQGQSLLPAGPFIGSGAGPYWYGVVEIPLARGPVSRSYFLQSNLDGITPQNLINHADFDATVVGAEHLTVYGGEPIGPEEPFAMALDTDGVTLVVTSDDFRGVGTSWLKKVVVPADPASAAQITTLFVGDFNPASTVWPFDCQAPQLIVNGGSGTFFFSSGSFVCKLTLTGTPAVTVVGNIANGASNWAISGLTVGPDGYPWATNGDTLARFTPSAPALYSMTPALFMGLGGLVTNGSFIAGDGTLLGAQSFARFSP